MQKRIEIQDLDIPADDIDCWDRYPKHRWVYDLSRLLDAQNIKWSPFRVDSLPDRVLNMELESRNAIIRQPGFIYVKSPAGNSVMTELFLIKGEIKHIRQIDRSTGKELEVPNGEAELRLSAFCAIYFQKFTGVISAETNSKEIVRIRLRPNKCISLEANQEVVKLLKRIYKKSDLGINGLTDQALHETLAT